MILIGNNNGNKTEEIIIDVDGPFDPGEFVDTLTINSPLINQIIRVGLTPGDGDLVPDTDILGGAESFYDFSLHRTNKPTDLYHISGLTGPVNIKIRR
jgi:hypothetical protein